MLDIPVPLGEVVDRISILRIKCARFEDPARRASSARELALLEDRWSASGHEPPPELEALEEVNGLLWDVEDALRRHEAAGDFGQAFVGLARQVYHLNDRRAALKRAVSERLGSELVEQKEYVPYGSGG